MVRDIKWLYRTFNRLNKNKFNGKLPPIKMQILDGKHKGFRCNYPDYLATFWYLLGHKHEPENCVISMFKEYLDDNNTPINHISVVGHEMAHYELYLKGNKFRDGTIAFERRLKELGFATKSKRKREAELSYYLFIELMHNCIL